MSGSTEPSPGDTGAGLPAGTRHADDTADTDGAADADGADADGTADADAGRSFEELVEELEVVTEHLAGGQIGIEQAADLYERAEALHRLAQGRLDAVRLRVDRLGEPPAPLPPG